MTTPPAGAPVALTQDAPAGASRSSSAKNLLHCAQCGVVGAVRELRTAASLSAPAPHAKDLPDAVGAKSRPGARTFEIAVRMSDGSRYVFTDPTPGNWRPGDRLIHIAGADTDAP